MAATLDAPTVTDPLEGALDKQAIRDRAYEISQSEDAATPEENWYRAERELRAATDDTHN